MSVKPVVPSETNRPWLLYSLLTVMLWGIWGAFSGLSAQRGFPDTLTYCVWSVSMIPPAWIFLRSAGWCFERDRRSIALGMTIGFLGAGGQMLLFYALTQGPAYLIFPVISLSPMITIALSLLLLGERTNSLGAIGIVLALVALPLLDLSLGNDNSRLGVSWFLLAIIVMACWGAQAYLIKLANSRMTAESIFLYMTLTGLLLIPLALALTDFKAEINWGWDGPWLAYAIQTLNAIGALALVLSFRYGKAIVIAPLSNAGAPLVTAAISLVVGGILPSTLKATGLLLALIASILLTMVPEEANDHA